MVAAQVLVNDIEQTLIIGVGVNGGHQALFDAERVMDDFHRGCQTVRRAGSVRDDMLPGRVVALFIDTQDKRHVLIGGKAVKGRRDDHLLHCPVEVRAGLRGVGEVTGTLDNDLRTHVTPEYR